MAINHSEKKKALKIMSEAPDSLRRAENLYKERLAAIREKELTGNWSPNTIKADRTRAREDYDLVAKRLIGQMKNAVYTINDNNSFDGESADFADPKFQSALTFINMMGHDMSAVDQINMLENFRGNPGALNALGAAMKKKGLYFADRAKEMCKTIPEQALEDAAYVVGKYEYNGEVDWGRMRWSKDEFAKAAQRYGYDMSDAPDPFISALMDARDSIPIAGDDKEQMRSGAAKLSLDLAIRDMQKAKQTGEGNAEQIFSDAIRRMERLTANPQSLDAE